MPLHTEFAWVILPIGEKNTGDRRPKSFENTHQTQVGADLGFAPFFRCRTATEIHDFQAHFGRKKPSR
jgi:hypothetical protein